MKKLNIQRVFSDWKYEWQKDASVIGDICHYTKTRIGSPSGMLPGMELPFVMKAIADRYGLQRFFEIGTGRGTTSYAVSQSSSIREIHTLDVIGFEDKRIVAIGGKKTEVSNSDLFKILDIPNKDKITFYNRNMFDESKFTNKFDFCFIDGDHNHSSVITDDFSMCKRLMTDDAVVVFDDYFIDRFEVKKAIDLIMIDNPDFEYWLLESRGYLFSGKIKDDNEGMIIASRKNIL